MEQKDSIGKGSETEECLTYLGISAEAWVAGVEYSDGVR